MITIAFKTTEEQEAFIRQQAEARETSVSEIIREAISGMRKKRRCRVTGQPGRVIVHAPPGTPIVTTAEVKAIEDEYYR